MAVRVDLNISLDGYATTTDGTPDDPIGQDWLRLVASYIATRTMRERVLHEADGQGTTGVDDRYAQEYFAEVGAEILGAGMFGLHTYPDDPDWNGWWGDEPPFRVPVLVLTHHPREPLAKRGTTFTFVTDGVESAVEQARAAAGDRNVAVGGGASVAQQVLGAGLLDELEIHLVPILLGGGTRLLDDLDPGIRLERVRVVDSPAVTHLRYRVVT
jgi:dihydrofolate reductase